MSFNKLAGVISIILGLLLVTIGGFMFLHSQVANGIDFGTAQGQLVVQGPVSQTIGGQGIIFLGIVCCAVGFFIRFSSNK